MKIEKKYIMIDNKRKFQVHHDRQQTQVSASNFCKLKQLTRIRVGPKLKAVAGHKKSEGIKSFRFECGIFNGYHHKNMSV